MAYKKHSVNGRMSTFLIVAFICMVYGKWEEMAWEEQIVEYKIELSSGTVIVEPRRCRKNKMRIRAASSYWYFVMT